MFARILHAFYRALGNQLSINYEFFCVHKAPLRQFKVFSWAKLARSIQRKHETNIFFQLQIKILKDDENVSKNTYTFQIRSKNSDCAHFELFGALIYKLD